MHEGVHKNNVEIPRYKLNRLIIFSRNKGVETLEVVGDIC